MIKRIAAIGLALLTMGSAQAAIQSLQGRDINGNPVDAYSNSAVFEYDPNLNVTWLRDWNYAKTSNYQNADSNGRMSWSGAVNWASTLVVGKFSGWELPSTNAGPTSNCSQNQSDGAYFGFNCTGSPMGYLWYTILENPAGGPPSNTGPFVNVQFGPTVDIAVTYWTSTPYAGWDLSAWQFRPFDGLQAVLDKSNPFYAVALRQCDVARPKCKNDDDDDDDDDNDDDGKVPVPATLALLALGLVGIGAVRRKQA